MNLIYAIIFTIVFSTSIFPQIFVEKELEDGVNYIVDFINSDKFRTLRNNSSDLELIDSIFVKAKDFYNDDISETLLALTFATLPFEKMPLNIPYLGLDFNVSLPSGDPNLLKDKIRNLPKNVFEDSPKSNFGDKDKTAHFFGNAYFSFDVTFFNLSKFLSIFVELFEDAFKVEGGIDNRDFVANHLGYLFGQELIKNPNSLPSETLKKYPNFKKYFEVE
jgi:hypothetical protein